MTDRKQALVIACALYNEHGLVPFVLGAGAKKPPPGMKWKDCIIKPGQAAEKIHADSNIAVLLGAPSGDVVDLDFDCAEARAIGDQVFGKLPAFGRASAPCSHRLARCAGAKSRSYNLPAKKGEPGADGEHGAKLLEIRSTKAYTMFPPSVHPTGEVVEWQGEGLELIPVTDVESLEKAAALCAFGAAMVRFYPPVGSRHEFCLALSGALARVMTEAGSIDDFVRAIGEAAGGGKSHKQRHGADAIAKVTAGEQVTGLPRLCELAGLDDVYVKTFQQWLYGESQDKRPRLFFNPMRLSESVDQAIAALMSSGCPIFRQGDRLVHVYRNDHQVEEGGVVLRAGSTVTRDVDSTRLTQYLDQHLQFFEPTEEGPKRVAAPSAAAINIRARKDRWDPIPVLNGHVEHPIILGDGRLLYEDGFDRPSGLLLDNKGVRFPEIPCPTLEESKRALSVIKDLLCDFPFVDDVARSVALAAILLALERRWMPDAPCIGIDASKRSTGKTALCDAICMIATGCRAAVMSQPGDDEESAKSWHAILTAGVPVVVVDNIDKPISDAVTCAVLTSPKFGRRLLGSPIWAEVPTNVLALFNGNNLAFERDLPSRALIARLDAGVEHPEKRKFKYRLDEYIPQHRPEIIAAAMTAMRGFVVAGRPMPFEPSRFKDFDALVRGTLVWCGEADPMLSQATIEQSDPTRADLAAIIEAMAKCFNAGANVPAPTAAEIAARANEGDDAGQELAAALRPHIDKGTINKNAISRVLSAHRDSIVDGRRIRRIDGKVARFWVEVVQGRYESRGMTDSLGAAPVASGSL